MKKFIMAFGRELYQGNISAMLLAAALMYMAWSYFGKDYYIQYKQEVAVSHELLGDMMIKVQELEAKLQKKEAKQELESSEYGVSLEGEY